MDINLNTNDETTLQSGLGADVRPTSNSGIIRIGEVTKIFPKRFSCEVIFEQTGEQQLSDSADEGKLAAPVTVSFAGYSETYKKAYGEIVPLHVGERVVCGIIGDGEAVVLGRLHINDEDNGENQEMNILYAAHDAQQNLDDWIRIFPNQDFFIRRENGDWEYSINNHSFIEHKGEFIPTDFEDYTDLSVTDINGNILELEPEHFRPSALFLSFVSSFVESAANHIKVYIEGMRSVFKIIQHIGNTVSYMRFWKDGSISIRRQLDTIETEGDTPSWNYADITFTPDKTIQIRVHGDHNTMVVLNDTGLNIFTDDNVLCNADKNITIRAKKDMQILANGKMNIHSDGEMTINTNSTLDVHSMNDCSIHTDTNLSLNANVNSTTNAGSEMSLRSGSDMFAKAGGEMIEQAPMIRLN